MAYAKQEGITARSGLERMTGNANLSHETGRVKVEASTLFSRILQNMTNEGTSFASPIMNAFWTASPSTVPYNEDGTFSSNFPLTNGANPVQTRTYNYDRNAITRSFNTLAATVTLWDELKLREKIAFDYTSSIESVWWDPRSNDGRSSNGVFQRLSLDKRELPSRR